MISAYMYVIAVLPYGQSNTEYRVLNICILEAVYELNRCRPVV